jgi:hypothetical protein
MRGSLRRSGSARGSFRSPSLLSATGPLSSSSSTSRSQQQQQQQHLAPEIQHIPGQIGIGHGVGHSGGHTTGHSGGYSGGYSGGNWGWSGVICEAMDAHSLTLAGRAEALAVDSWGTCNAAMEATIEDARRQMHKQV